MMVSRKLACVAWLLPLLACRQQQPAVAEGEATPTTRGCIYLSECEREVAYWKRLRDMCRGAGARTKSAQPQSNNRCAKEEAALREATATMKRHPRYRPMSSAEEIKRRDPQLARSVRRCQKLGDLARCNDLDAAVTYRCQRLCRHGFEHEETYPDEEYVDARADCIFGYVSSRGARRACILGPEHAGRQRECDADCVAEGEKKRTFSFVHVPCCDGTPSPTCTWGEPNKSLQGCCSHHGGICEEDDAKSESADDDDGTERAERTSCSTTSSSPWNVGRLPGRCENVTSAKPKSSRRARAAPAPSAGRRSVRCDLSLLLVPMGRAVPPAPDRRPSGRPHGAEPV